MTRRSADQRGFTMVESMVVLMMLGITLAIAVPWVTERMRSARIRVAAEQFSLHLKAVRLKAVSNRTTLDVVVAVDPANAYQYTDPDGQNFPIILPDGVRVASSTSPIRFQTNGAVTGGALTVFEIDLSGGEIERWTVNTNVLGIPSVTHERLQP